MAGLVLLIGVAGILNVGLATVGERVEEFALRRAVGTPALAAGRHRAGRDAADRAAHGGGLAIGVERGRRCSVVSAWSATRQPFLHDVQFPWEAGRGRASSRA